MNLNSATMARVFTWENLLLLLAAGAISEVVLEIISWWVFPPLLGVPMRPHLLVTAVTKAVFSADLSVTVAVSIHMALGLILMPVAFAVGREVFGVRSTIKPAIIYGVILWATAQMILAPLAGRPFMLGLIPYTWGSLVAHVVYTMVVAMVYDHLAGRAAD